MDGQEVASNKVGDGIFIDERIMRLDIIRLTFTTTKTIEAVIRDASLLTAFVLDGTVPEAKQPTHAPSGARIGPIAPDANEGPPELTSKQPPLGR